MKYIKQGLITANVWKTEDESKHNVQLLKLDECINTYYYQWTDIYLTLGIISEKAMAPHSSTLAWRIPWREEPGRLQSMGSLRVGPDWVTSLSLFTFMHWRRKWQPTPGSCLENLRDGGAWWAAVYGVAQSRKIGRAHV